MAPSPRWRSSAATRARSPTRGGDRNSWTRNPRRYLKLPIPPAERNSYYELAAIGDGYFRAFQTNGTPDYHRPDLLPDTTRFENGVHYTGTVRNGAYATALDGFDRGRSSGRNLWDRRYPGGG